MTDAASILGMVKNRLAENLRQLNLSVSEEDAGRLARFLLDDLEASRWRLVPIQPTCEMIEASMTAMRKRRKAEHRVGEKRKHSWRISAAIEAAPRWEATPAAVADQARSAT